jgi:hypothetical protein
LKTLIFSPRRLDSTKPSNRSLQVSRLNDEKIFTLAWLPGPFIAAEILAVALERIHRALTPGGWLIFGLYVRPPDKLGEALTNLRI